MLNPSAFYQADVVNYRGRTTDTDELYNEIVAKYVCEHIKDFAGKIDLLSYDGKTLYILELKKPDSTETLLCCVLEGHTYMKTAKTEKLLKDFELPANTKVVACPLVFFDGEQHKEIKEYRPYLKKQCACLTVNRII